MTAEAIRAAAANFRGCIERLWPAAARRGISRGVFQTYTASLTPDLRIMDLLDNQPEFTKSFWDYLDILVNDERIAKGRELLEKYRATFDAVEKAYGVDRYIIAAIWGVETNYGTHRRRPSGGPLDRHARLHRPAAELFPRGISLRAGNSPARRRAARPAGRLMGGRFRADPVHADGVQAIRRGFRSRRPPRRGRLGARPHRLDRQQSEEGRLGRRADLGLRSGGAGDLQFSARRPCAAR